VPASTTRTRTSRPHPAGQPARRQRIRRPREADPQQETKKPPHRTLLDWEKEFNKQINKIRYVAERTIANFKTWRILFTGYRRPRKTFPQTIKVVTALDEFRTYE
jgi:hypothetical protein